MCSASLFYVHVFGLDSVVVLSFACFIGNCWLFAVLLFGLVGLLLNSGYFLINC